MRPLLLSLLVCLALAACGQKASLKPPEGETREYPRTYPAS